MRFFRGQRVPGYTSRMASPKKDETVLRNLGRFTGEIWRAIKAPVPSKDSREVSRSVEEETRTTDSGRVTVRRTTIEEIEVEPRDPA